MFARSVSCGRDIAGVVVNPDSNTSEGRVFIPRVCRRAIAAQGWIQCSDRHRFGCQRNVCVLSLSACVQDQHRVLKVNKLMTIS